MYLAAIIALLLFGSALVYSFKDLITLIKRKNNLVKLAEEDEEMHKRIDKRLHWKFNHKTPILSFGDLTQPWDEIK